MDPGTRILQTFGLKFLQENTFMHMYSCTLVGIMCALVCSHIHKGTCTYTLNSLTYPQVHTPPSEYVCTCTSHWLLHLVKDWFFWQFVNDLARVQLVFGLVWAESHTYLHTHMNIHTQTHTRTHTHTRSSLVK